MSIRQLKSETFRPFIRRLEETMEGLTLDQTEMVDGVIQWSFAGFLGTMRGEGVFEDVQIGTWVIERKDFSWDDLIKKYADRGGVDLARQATRTLAVVADLMETVLERTDTVDKIPRTTLLALWEFLVVIYAKAGPELEAAGENAGMRFVEKLERDAGPS